MRGDEQCGGGTVARFCWAHLALNHGKERAIGSKRYFAGFRVRNIRYTTRGETPQRHADLVGVG